MRYRHGEASQRFVLIVAGIGLIILAVILLILFLLQGDTKYSEGEGSASVTASITCTDQDAVYPFRTAPGGGVMKIHAIIDDDKMKTVSLVYRLYYDDHSVIEGQTTRLNADMNRAFHESGLGADALNVTYSSFDDSVQMTLYAHDEDINNNTAKFFLLEDASGDYKKDEIMRIYDEKGFDCILDE